MSDGLLINEVKFVSYFISSWEPYVFIIITINIIIVPLLLSLLILLLLYYSYINYSTKKCGINPY